MADVISRTVISSVGMGVQGLARFGYTWVVANLVGPVEVGQVNTLLSVAVYAALFWPQGASVAASRYLPVLHQARPAITWLRHSMLISTAILSVIGAGVAWLLLGDLVATFSCAVLVASYGGYVFTRGALIGRDAIGRATLGDAISSAIALGALLLVILGELHWALLLPLAIGYLVFTVLAWPRDPAEEPSPELRRQTMRFTRDNSIAALSAGGLLPMTMVMVQGFDTAVTAGNFAVAMSLATPANMAAQALQQVLVPHFARLRSAGADALRRSHLRIFAASAAAFVAVFGVLIWLAPWLLAVFFDDRYAAGVAPMRALMAIVCVMSVIAAPSSYLVTTGHQRRYSRIWLIAFLLGTAVLLVASPLWGQWGALLGYAVATLTGSVAIVVTALTRQPRLAAEA